MCIVTFYHKTCRYTDHGNFVLCHAAVIAGVVRRQVRDGQQAGHLVNAHSLARVDTNAISEPGNQHGRITFRHEASLSQSLAFFEIISEGKVLNFGCN